MKLSEWRLRLKDSVSGALEKISGKADGTAGKFAKFQDKLTKFNTQSTGANKGLKGLFQGFSSLSNPMSLASGGLGGLSNIGSSLSSLASPIGIVTGSVAAVAGAFTYGAHLALDFDKGMAKINATAQLSRPELDKLRNKLIDVGKAGTGPIEDIPDAYEKILSQTGDLDLSMDILKTSLKGAQAGFADINLVAGATAQTLSIVGAKNTTANEVMDTLLKAKKVGAGEFSDFATYIPQLIAAGSNLNIAYKDTAGLFAYMTGKGIAAAESATLIQNAFSALGKSEITQGLQKTGVKVFDEKGNILAMDKIFASLHDKTAAMSSQQKSLYLESIGLVDAQAKSAFAILSGDSDKLSTTMNDVRNSAGELTKQLEATETPTQKWDTMMNRIKGGFIQLGYSIMPAISSALDWISSVTESIVKGVMDWYNNSELAQDVFWVISKLVESIASGVSALGASLKWIYSNLIKPGLDALSSMYSMIKAIFSGDWKKFSSDLDKSATGMLSTLGLDKTKDGQTLQIKDGKLTTTTQKLVAATETGKKMGTGLESPTSANSKSNDLKKSLQAGSSGITDGGKSQRNITVNITKLNEKIEIHSATVSESASQIEGKMIELLLRVTQGAEVALASSSS